MRLLTKLSLLLSLSTALLYSAPASADIAVMPGHHRPRPAVQLHDITHENDKLLCEQLQKQGYTICQVRNVVHDIASQVAEERDNLDFRTSPCVFDMLQPQPDHIPSKYENYFQQAVYPHPRVCENVRVITANGQSIQPNDKHKPPFVKPLALVRHGDNKTSGHYWVVFPDVTTSLDDNQDLLITWNRLVLVPVHAVSDGAAK